MSLTANLDLFEPGDRALALAHAAWGGRAFFTPVRRLLPDGTWLGAPDAADLASLGLVEVPYTFGEPDRERRQRLAEIAQPRALTAESAEQGRVRISVVPVPLGEPQGLDTLGFFAACRLALPDAHIVADLERLGHKLGQLCLSFGADTIIGTIVRQRELRLGARASSNELTRDEAARLVRAAGFVACESLPDGEVRAL
jgi:hypothetical protein